MHNIPFPSPQRPRILVQVSKIFSSILSYSNSKLSLAFGFFLYFFYLALNTHLLEGRGEEMDGVAFSLTDTNLGQFNKGKNLFHTSAGVDGKSVLLALLKYLPCIMLSFYRHHLHYLSGRVVFCLPLTCPPSAVGQRLIPWGTVSCASLFNHLAAVTCSTLSHRRFPVILKIVSVTNTSSVCLVKPSPKDTVSACQAVYETMDIYLYWNVTLYSLWGCSRQSLYVFQLSAHDALILSQPVSTPLPLRYHY